jgi:hypothetical protein
MMPRTSHGLIAQFDSLLKRKAVAFPMAGRAESLEPWNLAPIIRASALRKD